jgi:hypothetical protein
VQGQGLFSLGGRGGDRPLPGPEKEGDPGLRGVRCCAPGPGEPSLSRLYCVQAPRKRLPAGISFLSTAAGLRAVSLPPKTHDPAPNTRLPQPPAPEAEPKIRAGGDSKRRRGGGPGAGRGGAATDCGDAAARWAAQSVLGAEHSGLVRGARAVGCGLVEGTKPGVRRGVWARQGADMAPRRARARAAAGSLGAE